MSEAWDPAAPDLGQPGDAQCHGVKCLALELASGQPSRPPADRLERKKGSNIRDYLLITSSTL